VNRLIDRCFLILLLPAMLAPARQQPTTAPRFAYLDVFIDPRGSALAAYQFELNVDQSAATIVGVEGGEHAAFNAAPYYDPAALTHGRIIIAAFNTGSELPSARTRVARLHMRVTSSAPEYRLSLEAAAGASGKKLEQAVISFVEKGNTP
jgi:hypothetical protein